MMKQKNAAKLATLGHMQADAWEIYRAADIKSGNVLKMWADNIGVYGAWYCPLAAETMRAALRRKAPFKAIAAMAKEYAMAAGALMQIAA